MSNKKQPTRADLVRKRRAQEHEQHIKRAAKVAPRSAPATVKRPTAKTAAKSAQKVVPSKANNRREFNMMLTEVSRSNMHSVSMPRLQFSWRIVSFLLSVMFGAAIYYAFNLPQLRVTEATLTGAQMLTQAEMNSVLNVTGQPIFLLTPSDLETRLRLNYPELASVRVSITLPNQVSVEVRERQPLIRWEQGGGYTWVADDGIAFRPRGEMVGLISVVALSAPPVEGGGIDPLTPAPFISSEMIQAVKILAGRVPPGQPILYEAGNGFGWNDPRGWRVHFGTSANDMELKMRVYETMVASLTTRGIRPALINVVYPTAPFYRMSQ